MFTDGKNDAFRHGLYPVSRKFHRAAQNMFATRRVMTHRYLTESSIESKNSAGLVKMRQ